MDGPLIYGIMGVVLVGVGLLAIGALFVVKGLSTKSMIRAALLEEKASTGPPGEDGIEIQVVDAKTAKLRADQVKAHTLGRLGPFQALVRADDQENADFFLKGLTIRTALNLAIASFGVADMAVGAGVGLMLAGAGTLSLGLPLLFWLAP